jgi:hypothetical protein
MDGMILVAALAGGFALARLCWPTSGNFSPHSVREWGCAMFGATMIPCTVAAVVIRLMRPRPDAERLLCQPGMAASCAAIVAIAIGLCPRVLGAVELHFSTMRHNAPNYQFYHHFWYIYSLPIGPAVAATWLALMFSGRWRPERGWIDRLGRILGGCWILFVFVQWEYGRWVAGLVQVLVTRMKHP